MNKIILLSFIGTGLILTAGCTPVGLAAGAAATTGVAAAQEGGLRRAVSDSWIKTQINHHWLQYDVDTFAKLSTTVKQGRVLITGVVQNPEARVEAVRLVWQVEGVKQVINEIRVADSEGITGFVTDNWIASRLRTAILFDKEVQSINYSIDAVQGVVYLMGFAQSQAELNRVIETARTISGVKQVVSYVKLVGEQGENTIQNGNTQNFEARGDTAAYAAPQPIMDPSDDMTGSGMGYEEQGGSLTPPAVESEPLQ
jgi:osmotically-inducible protein OsmY